MSVKRMDNVGIIVEDLKGAIEFFQELGLELEGEASVGGPWVDGLLALEDVKADIAMMRTPDGDSMIELSSFRSPKARRGEAKDAPMNTLGIRRIMFAVDDIDGMVARLKKRGTKLLGEVVQYEDIYRLCYVRGPEGILVALAEKLK